MSATQLAARTNLVRNSVWNALDGLRQYGLITTEGTDRVRLFRVNAEHPLAPAIGGLFKAEGERLDAIFAEIKAGGQRVKDRIAGLWLYGSVVRQEDGPGSDIDIALVTKPGDLEEAVHSVREHVRDAGERLFFLPNVVGLDFDDVRRLAGDDDPWWKSCSADALVLLGKHPTDLAREIVSGGGHGQKRAG